MHEYLVYSPDFIQYAATDIDPPEYGACALEVLAESKREAIKIAIKDPEFSHWVADARSDCKNPFTGIKVECLDVYTS